MTSGNKAVSFSYPLWLDLIQYPSLECKTSQTNLSVWSIIRVSQALTSLKLECELQKKALHSYKF